MTARGALGVVLMLGASALAAAACSSGEDDPDASEDHLTETDTPLEGASAALVSDPKTLTALEADFSLARWMDAKGGSGAELAATERFSGVVETIRQDLSELQKADKELGTDFGRLGHRLFDIKWLHSKATRFELIGIANRIEGALIDPESCGEVAFIYRLAYTRGELNGSGQKLSSRLPMTVSVVIPQAGERGCKAVAQNWLAKAKAGDFKELLGSLGTPSAIEINVQAVRWPSSVRPELGGHSEYLLRTFKIEGNTATPTWLENTPRTDLSADEKTKLADFVTAHAAEVDLGTVELPEEFLDKRVYSYGPRGMSRLPNRRFKQLFDGNGTEAFAKVDLSAHQVAKSPEGFLRRLDAMTCPGCHQDRSIAGFHMLGDERDDDARWNSLVTGISPHLRELVAFRVKLMGDMAEGRPLERPHPFPEHMGTSGKYGEHCGTKDATFKEWTCKAGLACELAVEGEDIGSCTTPKNGVGDPTEHVKVVASADPHKDGATISSNDACGSSAPIRASSKGGFPSGACLSRCNDVEYGVAKGDGMCAPIPFGKQVSVKGRSVGFNECVLSSALSFLDCSQGTSDKVVVRRCDAANSCRDDYVCARVPGAEKGVGGCMPTYFVFQTRLDGHIIPD